MLNLDTQIDGHLKKLDDRSSRPKTHNAPNFKGNKSGSAKRKDQRPMFPVQKEHEEMLKHQKSDRPEKYGRLFNQSTKTTDGPNRNFQQS